MRKLRCPFCESDLRPQVDAPWEDLRTHLAVHLRSCVAREITAREARMIAISVADEIVDSRPGSSR